MAANAADDKEYLVKAAFMYNFVKFVEWPGDLAIAKNSGINICVLGEDPFGPGAREVFARASNATLKLSVVQRQAANTSDCHIAFISRSEEGRLPQVMAALKSRPVLTVSDIGNFADKNGGIIGFVTQDNKIKLVVNTVNATAAGLRVDAQLLEIALQVIRN